MSEFRIEKRREPADVTLVTGATVSGVFFLAGSSQVHSGPERVGDVLNIDAGFFPFESNGETSLINRAHVLKVVLTTGEVVTGHVVVFRPPGRDRLSDYAHIDERFRYVELADRTLLINSAHIVALSEVHS
jgi:hypothetical protein